MAKALLHGFHEFTGLVKQWAQCGMLRESLKGFYFKRSRGLSKILRWIINNQSNYDSILMLHPGHPTYK